MSMNYIIQKKFELSRMKILYNFVIMNNKLKCNSLEFHWNQLNGIFDHIFIINNLIITMENNNQLYEQYNQFQNLITLPDLTTQQKEDFDNFLSKQVNIDMQKKIQYSLRMIGRFKSLQQLQQTYYKINEQILQKYYKNQQNIKRRFLGKQLEKLQQNGKTDIIFIKKLQQIIVENLILFDSKDSKGTFINKIVQNCKQKQEILQKIQRILQIIFVKFQKINTIRNFSLKYDVQPKTLFAFIKENDRMGFQVKMNHPQINQRKRDIQDFIRIIFLNKQQQIKFFQTIKFLDQFTYSRKKSKLYSTKQSSNGKEDYIILKNQDQYKFDKYFKFLVAIELHNNVQIANQKLNICNKQNQKIPYEAIGNIKSYINQDDARYTVGFLISKNLVLTCAHAIIDKDKSKGEQYQKIIFILEGKQYMPIRYYYPKQYKQSYDKEKEIAQKEQLLNDFAILQLDTDVDLSETHGYFGLYGKDLDESTNDCMQLLGLMNNSSLKHQLLKRELQHIKVPYRKSSYGNIVGYNANTRGGFSGSPGFIMQQDHPFVISIHTNRIDPIHFSTQKQKKNLQQYIYKSINQLNEAKQKFFGQQIKKIQYLIEKLNYFKNYGQLCSPVILGTYIGEQIKNYINQWIDIKKLDLTLSTSKEVGQLINIISTRNSNQQQYKIKHLILNNKDLKSKDIIKIFDTCKNLFYMTALQLQGNDLKHQFSLLPQLKYFSYLEHLNLNDTGITNKDIQQLKQLKYLAKLQIAKKNGQRTNEINDEILLRFYDGFKSLKELDINGYLLNQEKIKQLKQKRASLKIIWAIMN